ncbi:MAG: hypothetical protein GC137_00305 [Alphaproteobacteria bacterium]|nr:hypothetical protein [Alphaproteobacteria bacterium]
MGLVEQNGRDLSYASEAPEGARVLWAIQIATVDSLKWRGLHRTASFLGRNTVEHSYTRLAEIWCDKEGNPLVNKKTGELLPAVYVHGMLNPAAIDPVTGDFVGLRIDPHTVRDITPRIIPTSVVDLFNRITLGIKTTDQPKCKLGIFSLYEDDITLDANYVVPTPVMVGEEENILAHWLVYQRRAMSINLQGYDYDLRRRNCHTVNAALNDVNKDAVRAFTQRGFMRWGTRSQEITVPESAPPIIRSLESLRQENAITAEKMRETHQISDVNHQNSAPEENVETEAFPSYN